MEIVHMTMNASNNELTLDPRTEAEWDELRSLGHRMLDEMFSFLQTVRERPAWQAVPDVIKQHLAEPLPMEPANAAAVYESFRENVLPYPTGNIHPRFWGWVMGTGTPLAMLADMLASGMNVHLAGYDQSAMYVERQVLSWLTALMGMPQDSSGLLVTGGTMANLIGLTVARNAKAGIAVRKEGLQKAGAPRLVAYCSTETHSWAQKAVELLGLGDESLRRIPVNANFEMDVTALREQISQDRRQGFRPFCVIGNAGTVSTGATDDLQALADLCSAEDMWFHVDGAFGALAVMSPQYRSIVKGMERADSLAFDLHKWMYLPYEVGCVLVRDAQAHREAFALAPSYLASAQRGIAVETTFFADLGLQLSRGFRALKVWMSLKTHGANLIGKVIEQNIEQAQHLRRLVESLTSLELLAPAPLNVVCFRYRQTGLSEAQLDELNEEILLRLQESGLAVPSGVRINGKFALRVAHTNHRTRYRDFDLLVERVVSIGQSLEAEQRRRRISEPMYHDMGMSSYS
jgi:aromatic-L-amino-acid/L-tryptophan decarboxylase